MTSHGESKGNEQKECELSAQPRFYFCEKDSDQDSWTFLGPGSEKEVVFNSVIAKSTRMSGTES